MILLSYFFEILNFITYVVIKFMYAYCLSFPYIRKYFARECSITYIKHCERVRRTIFFTLLILFVWFVAFLYENFRLSLPIRNAIRLWNRLQQAEAYLTVELFNWSIHRIALFFYCNLLNELPTEIKVFNLFTFNCGCVNDFSTKYLLGLKSF